MSLRAVIVSGTILSLTAVSAWSFTATLTIGPSAPLHLSRNLTADYARLAAASTGNGAALFAVTAAIYFACFTVSGLRRIRREPAGRAPGVSAGRVTARSGGA